MHRNSSSPLPNSIPPSSIAESFCSFFWGKITTIRLSLQSLSSKTTIDSSPDILSTTDDSPPSPPPASLSTFLHQRLKYFIFYNLSPTNSANWTLIDTHLLTERLCIHPCSHHKK